MTSHVMLTCELNCSDDMELLNNSTLSPLMRGQSRTFCGWIKSEPRTSLFVHSMNSLAQEVKVIFRSHNSVTCTADCTNRPRMFPSINIQSAER